MEKDGFHYLGLAVCTFILLFVLLVACVRSCARITEQSVLASMEPEVRSQYLSTGTRGADPRRYRRWLSPWPNHRQPGGAYDNPNVFVISTVQLAPTSASYDVTTTALPAANYHDLLESALPSYEDAVRQSQSDLPSYHQWVNETKEKQKEETENPRLIKQKEMDIKIQPSSP